MSRYTRCALIVMLVATLSVGPQSGTAQLQAQPATFGSESPVRWWSSIDREMLAPQWDPVSSNSDSIFLATPNDVSALDIETGEQLWSTALSRSAEFPPNFFTMVFTGANDEVVATVIEKELFVLDSESGEVLWSHTTTTPDLPSAPTVTDTLVIINELDEARTSTNVIGFDMMTGEIAWTIAAGPVDVYPMSISGDQLVVADVAGGVVSIDTADGAIDWQNSAGTTIRKAPMLTSNATVVEAFDGGQLFATAFDPSTGTPLWSTAVNRVLAASDQLVLFEPENEASTTVAADLATGQEIWRIEESIENAVFGELLYATRMDGSLVALLPDSGELAWASTAAVGYSPIIAGDRVITLGDQGLYLFDAATGDLLYSFDPSFGAGWMQQVTDQLFALHADDGSIMLLDTSKDVGSNSTMPQSIPASQYLVSPIMIPVPSADQLLFGLWRVELNPGEVVITPDFGGSMVAVPIAGAATVISAGVTISPGEPGFESAISWPPGIQELSNIGSEPASFYLVGLSEVSDDVDSFEAVNPGVTVLSYAPIAHPPVDTVWIRMFEVLLPAGTETFPTYSVLPQAMTDASGVASLNSANAPSSTTAQGGEFSTLSNPGGEDLGLMLTVLTPGGEVSGGQGGCSGRCM